MTDGLTLSVWSSALAIGPAHFSVPPGVLATGRRAVLLMESRHTPDSPDRPELARKRASMSPWYAARLESFSALFPSLTKRGGQSGILLGPRRPAGSCGSRGFRSVANFRVAWEFSRATPWIGSTGTNGKNHRDHLVVAPPCERAVWTRPMGGNVGPLRR